MKNRTKVTKVTFRGDRKGLRTQRLMADVGHSCVYKTRRVNERTKSWYNKLMTGKLEVTYG